MDGPVCELKGVSLFSVLCDCTVTRDMYYLVIEINELRDYL